MTKNELMEMARECGYSAADAMMFNSPKAQQLANAILERAAVECEERRESVSQHVSSRDCIVFNQGLMKSSEAIRALKL